MYIRIDNINIDISIMYVLKNKYGSNIGCYSHNKSYIIGFNCPKMAKKTIDVIQRPPVMRIDRANMYDVTEDVKSGLELLGVHDLTFTSITLDTEALLSIDKAPKQKRVAVNSQEIDINIECMKQEEFFFLTFEKNLGLVMPYEELYEDDDTIVFKSNIIDPALDTETFKKSLKI